MSTSLAPPDSLLAGRRSITPQKRRRESSLSLCKICQGINFAGIGFQKQSSLLQKRTTPSNYPLEDLGQKRRLYFPFKEYRSCEFCHQVVDAVRRRLQASQGGEPTAWIPFFISVVDYRTKSNSSRRINSGILSVLRIESDHLFVRIDFQRRNAKPLHVPQRSRPFTPSHFPIEPFDGRVRDLNIDWALLDSWNQHCEKDHENCAKIYAGTRSSWLRLIDVRKYCLVETIAIDTWATLSYVWGGKQKSALTKANREKYLNPGSLSDDGLPLTIRDAIEVTRRLSMPYLWVDALCICQDDPEDVALFIEQMSEIYGLSSLTIIAADGRNANSGLAGVTRTRRSCIQKPFQISDVHLVDAVRETWSPQDSSSVGTARKWNTRAWTFQEKLCSRRTLTFMAESVYWECLEGCFTEDNHGEMKNHASIFYYTLSADTTAQLKLGSWVEYPALVYEYSGRSMTIAADYINAFSGILKVLERNTGHSFFWALPTQLFTPSLLWSIERYVGRMRKGTTVVRGPSKRLQCPFPSWSWTGWKGRTKYHGWIQGCERLTSSVEFYRYDFHGSPIAICERRRASCPRDRTVKRSMLPSPFVSDEVAQGLISFWAMTAILSYESYHAPGASDIRGIFDGERVIVDDHEDVLDLPSGSRHLKYGAKFAVIGAYGDETRYSGSGMPEQLDQLIPHDNKLAVLVLSITPSDRVEQSVQVEEFMKEEDFVRHRMGWVRIHTDAWDKVQWEWELIHLG